MQSLIPSAYKQSNPSVLLSNEEQLIDWLTQNLRKFLGLENVDEIAHYLLDEIDTEQDLRSYLTEFLGNTKNVQRFIDNLITKKRGYVKPRKLQVPSDVQVYKKGADDEDELLGGLKKKKDSSSNAPKDTSSNSPTLVTATHNVIIKQEKPKKSKTKAKAQQVGIYCDCQATEHPLLRNCLSCGKILCAQEGSSLTSPCTFCGDSPGAKKKGGESGGAAVSPAAMASLEKAVQQKDQLLEYDRNAAKRTVVYDDQADYFSTNIWLSAEEREKHRKREEQQRLEKELNKRRQKITFDFAGRKILVDHDAASGISPEASTQYSSSNDSSSSSNNKENKNKRGGDDEHAIANPNISVQAPVFTASHPHKGGDGSKQAKSDKDKERTAQKIKSAGKRIQHEYFAVEIDEELQHQLQQQQQQKKKSKPEFQLRGLVDNNAAWSLSDKKQLVQLMSVKGMNHYLFVQPQQQQQQQTSNNNDLDAVIDLCKGRNIEFNYGVVVTAETDLTSQQTTNELVQRCVRLCESKGVSHFTLLMDPTVTDLTPEQKKVHKSLASAQAALINELYKQISSKIPSSASSSSSAASTSATLYVYPTFSSGDFGSDDTAPSRQEVEYWTELNKAAHPSCFFLFRGPSSGIPNTLTPQYFDRVNSFFSTSFNSSAAGVAAGTAPTRRRFLLWDYFPPASDAHPNLPFLGAYQGREPGLESVVDGVLISPMILSSGSGSNFSLSLFSLSTAFDFLRSPLLYDPSTSLKSALLNLLMDERIAEDLYTLVEIAPSPLNYNAYYDSTAAGDGKLLIRKFKNRQFVEEVSEKIHRVRHCSLRESQKKALLPYLDIVQAYLDVAVQQVKIKNIQKLQSLNKTQKKQKENTDTTKQKNQQAAGGKGNTTPTKGATTATTTTTTTTTTTSSDSTSDQQWQQAKQQLTVAQNKLDALLKGGAQ